MEEKKTEGKLKLSALLPIGVFLALFVGVSLLAGDFAAMPAIVAFLIALLAAFLQNPRRRRGPGMTM